jgi:hypothetical protein
VFFPSFRVDVLCHNQPLFRWNRFDPINPGCLLALIVLCHSSDSDESRRLGFHQQFLEFVNCSRIATLTGSENALL